MVLLLGVSVLVLLTVEATPPGATVYRAWPSGECRAVFNAEGIPVGCAELPPLHYVVWVSQHWDGDAVATADVLARTAAADNPGRS